jgi:hypothetical protein
MGKKNEELYTFGIKRLSVFQDNQEEGGAWESCSVGFTNSLATTDSQYLV